MTRQTWKSGKAIRLLFADHNLLLAWLATFFLLHLKRQPIKSIANYDVSFILVMYLKNSVLTLLAF